VFKIENLAQKLAIIGGIIALLTSLGGALLWVDHRYTLMKDHQALAGEVSEVKKTQQYMGFSYQQRSVEDRINKLEDRYQDKQMPQSVKEEYKNLTKQNDELKTILQEMNKKSIESVK
jgi:exonuclease VII large subunit